VSVCPHEPLVSVRDLFCVHRTPDGDAASLQGATLEVGTGEIVCVLGPSGAGKSTLLRTIAGLQVPSAGVVAVAGYDIGRLRAGGRARLRHELIGFMDQHPEAVLAPDLPIADAVALPVTLRGGSLRAARARALELLSAVGLGERPSARPSELSGGERQRAALCLALAHRPVLLLADEPTGELDAASARAVRAVIAQLARAHGVTVVLVSHDPDSQEVADRTVHIRDGRLAEDRVNGRGALVVGRGGWIQLPSAALAEAGIGDRAHVEVHEGRVVLTAALTARPAPAAAAPPGSLGPRALPAPEPTWAPARVRVRSLTRTVGRGADRRDVLAGLDAEVPVGRLTVITGRSGSGKTTLLRILAGLERADSGTVEVDGAALESLDAEDRAALRRARVGYLPQDPAPVGFLSVTDNVVLALRLRGVPRTEAVERAGEAVGAVGLAERARQRVSRLSAGEAQRAALARALAGARGLLIVDEPSSRLDQAGAARVADLLSAAAATEGQTVICATHDPELIARADHMIEL
jgi:ABC-type lipoprotein export system ATPase subunit